MMLRSALFALAMSVAQWVSAQGTAGSAAQSYPNKPARIVVGYTAGGAVDVVARIVARNLSEAWRQSFIVENRTGASGVIGADHVAKSAPDGYTLLVAAQTSQAVAPSLYQKVPYDPIRDFSAITMFASAPQLLVVNPSLPVRSVAELIAYAKANPGKLTFGSGGIGSSPHLSGELFKQVTGIDMMHVPYKGEAPELAKWTKVVKDAGIKPE